LKITSPEVKVDRLLTLLIFPEKYENVKKQSVQFYVCVRGLVSKYNNIIAMEMRQVFSNFGSLKNDVLRVLIEPLRFLILILK
jgi:hypothetical protein